MFTSHGQTVLMSSSVSSNFSLWFGALPWLRSMLPWSYQLKIERRAECCCSLLVHSVQMKANTSGIPLSPSGVTHETGTTCLYAPDVNLNSSEYVICPF